MVERIAELVREKRIEGIAELRDESDRQGMRVVIELKRDAERRRRPQPALSLHPAAIDFRRQRAGAQRRPPELMSLKDLLVAFVEFREEVVSRRTKFLLNKARDRAHVLVGPGDRRRQYRRSHPPHPLAPGSRPRRAKP